MDQCRVLCLVAYFLSHLTAAEDILTPTSAGTAGMVCMFYATIMAAANAAVQGMIRNLVIATQFSGVQQSPF